MFFSDVISFFLLPLIRLRVHASLCVCGASVLALPCCVQLLKLDGKTNLRLCDEATLQETCGAQKGSLSYLALLHDKDAGKVKFAIDKALLDDAVAINAHPLRCDRTTSVAPAGKENLT